MRTEYKRLIEMVKKGVPDKEIMEELGIQTRTSLKKMYYDALVEAGKIRDILTQRQAKRAATKKRPVRITKRGTVLLGRAVVIDTFGFKEGDRFIVSKRKDAIILRKEKEGALS
ncbi:MAG: hypothetical protein GTO24_19090 [candidate division Zixibacteria bacterium]|nr:hypothetical protein [candidate division Zixibacteria bacterium]